jgi:hypothetical protein
LSARVGGAAPALRDESVFFPMAPGYRVLAIAAYAGFFAWAAFSAAANRVPDAFVMTAALALFLAVRTVPLVFHRPGYGWFHPLVFSTLFAFSRLLREVPAFITGMTVHNALPGRTPWELDRLYAAEMVLAAVGLVFYYVGFLFPATPPVPALRFPRVANLRVRALAVVAAATLVLAAFLARRGGLTAHMLSWAKGRSAGLAGEGYWIAFAGLGTTAVFLWFVLDRRAMRSPLFWMATLVVSAGTFVASGSRGGVIYPIALAFLLWVFRERRVPVARGLLLAAGGMAMLGALGAVRHSTWTGRVDWRAAFVPGPDAGGRGGAAGELARRSLSIRGTTAVLGRVPHDVDYIYGSSYVALLTLPVPRKLWPEKPVLVGGRMGRTFFSVRAGMPPGTIGEAYWNFGLLGIPLVFFFFGMFHRWLWRFMLAYPEQPLAMALYLTLLFHAQPSTGGVMETLLRTAPLLGLALAFGALRLRRPAEAPAPAGALVPAVGG